MNMILYTDVNGGLSKDNKIPFSNKYDLQYFKQTTKHKTVVMGRGTWESLHVKPLPHRKNIIISTTLDPSTLPANVVVYKSIQEFLSSIDTEYTDIFIIGGSSLYNYFYHNNLIHTIYYNIVYSDFCCDHKINFSLLNTDPSEWHVQSNTTLKEKMDRDGYVHDCFILTKLY